MRLLLQRVLRASVRIEGGPEHAIGRGLVLLLGVTHGDRPEDADWLAAKVAALRVFDGPDGRPAHTLVEIGGEALAVSQFTLYGTVRKGTRPSWNDAAPPELARPLWERFAAQLLQELGRPVVLGEFGAHMEVALVNDGPVTLLLEHPAPRTEAAPA